MQDSIKVVLGVSRADEKPTKKIGLKRSTSVKCQDRKKPCIRYEHKVFLWLREPDLNQRPSGYEEINRRCF